MFGPLLNKVAYSIHNEVRKGFILSFLYGGSPTITTPVPLVNITFIDRPFILYCGYTGCPMSFGSRGLWL